MATVSPVTMTGIYTIYDIEPAAWANPTVLTFDKRGSISVDSNGIIDIVILGDGYTSTQQSNFENYASHFYDSLIDVWPFSEFQSAFRVRAVFVASSTVSDAAQPDTYYNVGVHSGGIARGSNNEDIYRESLFNSLAALNSSVPLNLRIFPDGINTRLSESSEDGENLANNRRTAFGSKSYSDVCRNLTVVQAVNRTSGSKSGYATTVAAPEGHSLEGIKVRVGFGEYDVHEFGHSFAYLSDEYIEHRSQYDSITRVDPGFLSVFTLSNLSFSYSGAAVPWRHLSWDGKQARDGNSYVAQQWVGGRGYEKGVWHAEYKCLMNGDHNNYHHSTDESRTPASLRTRKRFCLWCEELVTIRILEATNAFSREEDPSEATSINELGNIWYKRWVDELRDNYWNSFDLPTRISDRELWYKNAANLQVPGNSGGTWDGDLAGSNLLKEITDKPKAGLWVNRLLKG